MKTSELNGAALDWAAALCEGIELTNGCYNRLLVDGRMSAGQSMLAPWRPTTDWAQGGPIIEREQMDVQHYPDHWVAQLLANRNWKQTIPSAPGHEKATPLNSAYGSGPTMLIAAMRCYVASKLGANVELPEGLQ